MSLEEFLGDDSLGDSVWNEDDINLDAINNTINIEVLKNSHPKNNSNNNNNTDQSQIRQHVVISQYSGKPTMSSSSSFHQNDHYKRQNNPSRNASDSYMNNQQPFVVQGPPYMIKFSNLPPRFADSDIEELFEAKYTRFVKFKIFWEINKNPSISTLKSGSIFDQNFKRDSKVAFVEVYSARDIMKILKYWSQPLKEIYKINIEPAQYDDFKEYISKINLLTDPSDDPSKPYLAPKNKPSPFGTDLPTDTPSKMLDIEEKMGKLHVEDKETLERLSKGEQLESLKPKITILKKPQLSYSEVAQHSLLNSTKKNLNQGNYPGKVAESPSNTAKDENDQGSYVIKQGMEYKENSTEYTNDADLSEANENGDMLENGTKSNFEESNKEESSKNFTFKYQDRDVSPNNNNNNVQNYYRSYRGGRGGSFRGRGGYGGRGGRGGNLSRGFSNRGRGGYNQRFENGVNNNSNNNNRNNSYRRQTSEEKDNGPSLFAPASGFLQTTIKNDRSGYSNTSRGRGGYHRGHSSYRGSYN